MEGGREGGGRGVRRGVGERHRAGEVEVGDGGLGGRRCSLEGHFSVGIRYCEHSRPIRGEKEPLDKSE